MFTLIAQLVGFIVLLSPFLYAFVVVMLESFDVRSKAQKTEDSASIQAAFERLRRKHEKDVTECLRHRQFMNGYSK